jgi:AcrR family transcriptional regulator
MGPTRSDNSVSQKASIAGADYAVRGQTSDTSVMEIKFAENTGRKPRKRAPGRPTLEQASELRDTVLHAALRVFMKRGYEAASIEGIAREAKVAKITLYRQFGNKEALFFEVTRFAQAGVKRNLEAAVDMGQPTEVVLREMILRLHQGMTHPDYLAVLRLVIGESQRFPKIADAMLHDSDFILEPLIRFLRKLHKEGRITLESPRDSALQLSCLALGGARYLMVKPSNDPQAHAHWADALTTLFTRAWQLKPLQAPSKPASKAPRGKANGAAR